MALTIDRSGKVVLITGVSSGIGKSIAQVFADAGADIAGCATAESDEAFTGLATSHGVRKRKGQDDFHIR